MALTPEDIARDGEVITLTSQGSSVDVEIPEDKEVVILFGNTDGASSHTVQIETGPHAESTVFIGASVTNPVGISVPADSVGVIIIRPSISHHMIDTTPNPPIVALSNLSNFVLDAYYT